ncbi:MAG: hypothetical protein MMC23_001683 [Stictis urceolatum]|nr:hypothetical protein [Stictis urceolata]
MRLISGFKPSFIQYLKKSIRTLTSFPQRSKTQNKLPVAYYRGGTSRAVLFQRNHLPKDRSLWDEIFRGVIGSPDANGRQLDGLGGGISSLSKVGVVGKSDRADADVDFTFAALGVKDTSVDYSSNCGNITSAIGPFAVDSGLVRSSVDAKSDALVRIHNTNTGKIIHSTFPVIENGDEAASVGSFAIDGVAGTAARIQLDFVNPAGSKTGKLFPTGKAVDVFEGVRTTCIDVGNPCSFVKAEDLGVRGDISPSAIEEQPRLMGQLDRIRRSAGVAMGLASELEDIPGSIPKIAMISSMDHHHGQTPADLTLRALSVAQAHKAVPITVGLSVAAAALSPNTVIAECLGRQRVDPAGIMIAHPSGRLMVSAAFDAHKHLSHATVFRTARKIMEGNVFWKQAA